MSSNLTPSAIYFPIAQLVEHLTVNQIVAGSSPAREAKMRRRINSWITRVKVVIYMLQVTYALWVTSNQCNLAGGGAVAEQQGS